jgi:hypothetical protein
MQKRNLFKCVALATIGLFVGNNKTQAQTTYKDIAPILIAKCASCHHTGGLQFPLTGYSKAVAMASLIKQDILNNRMPPWPADPNYKHYVNERVVSQSDKNLLLDWINTGTPAGDTTIAAVAPNYSGYQLNGTPDLELSYQTYTSTATTQDHYVSINIPVNIAQDRIIRAFEYVPSNASLIHHAVMTIDTTGTAVDDLSGQSFNFQGQINIGDYAPGTNATVLPNAPGAKFGMRLKAGSKMSLQLHVPKGTSGQTETSRLRLYFYPINEPNVREMYFETMLQNWTFSVPANQKITTIAAYPETGTLPATITLFSAWPHSHLTCTEILNFAHKGTDTIKLVSIPKWDFHWQGQYVFPNMIKVPQGYRFYSSHVFDNTINNPNTPNHNLPVNPGLFTEDEMHFDSYIYCEYQTGDENIDIASILANEPLLNPTSVSEINKSATLLKVYPNPSTSVVYFDYTLMNTKYVQLKIYSILGQEVKTISGEIQSVGNHQLTWDRKEAKLPVGQYFYKLQAGKEALTGKIILE